MTRRRWAACGVLGAAFCFAAAAVPQGLPGVPAAAPSPDGPLVFRGADFGLTGDNATDNGPLLQAAVDRIRAVLPPGSGARAVLRIASSVGAYNTGSPVWCDVDGLEIHGAGDGATVVRNVNKQPVFIFGVNRSQQIDAAGTVSTLAGDGRYRPDCFGKLDASAAASAGRRWGLRTNANAVVQFHGSALDGGPRSALGDTYPDAWTETDRRTDEFCVEPPDGQDFPPGSALLGSGNFFTSPAPVCYGMGNFNRLYVRFKTSDGVLRGFKLDLTGKAKPYRVAVQFDLKASAFSAFVNGSQVALIEPENLTGAGLHFAGNDQWPYLIGGTGMAASYGGPTGLDLRLYGLRLSNTVRYQANGAGTKQTRADAPKTPPDDAWAYSGDDAHTVAYLPGDTDPAATTSGTARVVAVRNGRATVGGTSIGLLLNTYAATERGGAALRNLTVVGGGTYGQVVCLGALFNVTLENITARGGYHGVGSFAIGSTYYVNLLGDVYLSGSDAAYYGVYQILANSGKLNFDESGRVTVRLAGCDAFLQNLFVAGYSPTCEGFVRSTDQLYGGNFDLQNMIVDFEGYSITGPAFYFETVHQCPNTSVTMRNVFLGTVGPTACLIRLRQTGPIGGGLGRGYIQVENLQTTDSVYTTAVDADGPGWRGHVSGGCLPGKTRLTNTGAYGPTTGIDFLYQ